MVCSGYVNNVLDADGSGNDLISSSAAGTGTAAAASSSSPHMGGNTHPLISTGATNTIGSNYC